MFEYGKGDFSKRAHCSSDEKPRCCFATPKLPDDPRLFCCRCAHTRRVSPLTCLAICFLVLTYNLIGGFLFLALEGTSLSEETAVAASKPNLSQSQGDLRSRTVEKLWSITEDLNILYKENWTKLAAKELMDFQNVLIKSIQGGVTLDSRMSYRHNADYRWTFSGSFLYALTLITTIGHGQVTPKSGVGKLVAVAYACVGIPIVMLYLSTLGSALARAVRALYAKARPSILRNATFHSRTDCLHPHGSAVESKQYGNCDKINNFRGESPRTPFQVALNLDNFSGGYHWTCRDHTRVPIIFSLLLIASYLALGTFVFHKTERWSFVEGCYFSFSSLATIGFGDLKPGSYGSTVSAKAEDVAVGVCCIYILVGIVVIAMCFNLIQEDLSSTLRNVAALCPSGFPARATDTTDKWGDDRISMSVVS